MDDEDPLQAFGRFVKAGKTLWKQVSNKDVAAAAAISMPKPRVDSKGRGELTHTIIVLVFLQQLLLFKSQVNNRKKFLVNKMSKMSSKI